MWGTGGLAPKKGGGGMCLRYVKGSTGQRCKGARAGGSAQFGSYDRHGYTRPLSSRTGCADAVPATSKTNSAATASIIRHHTVGLPRYRASVSAAFPNVALSKGIVLFPKCAYELPYDSGDCIVRRIKILVMSGSSIGQFAGFWRCLHLAFPVTMVARLPVTWAYDPHPEHVSHLYLGSLTAKRWRQALCRHAPEQ
jgi:hypothetical protein